jgi:hypothetical protein
MDFFDLNEATTRYSVEVNFRTTAQEVKDGFAKLLLGYVSAALKQRGYHVKKVMDQKPFRILVSARNWTEGEWVMVISFNNDQECFVLSRGFYNKDRDTVTIQSSEKCAGETAADVFRIVFNKMDSLRKEPPHHHGLKGVHKKPGPKSGIKRPTQSYQNFTKFGFSPKKDDRIGM